MNDTGPVRRPRRHGLRPWGWAGAGGALLLACAAHLPAQAGSGAPAAPSAPPPLAAPATANEDAAMPFHVVTRHPGSAALPLEASTLACLRQRLQAGTLDQARLTLVFAASPAQAASVRGIRLFVEQADADAGTPSTSARYGGAFVFSAAGTTTPSIRQETALLNIAPVLRHLWQHRAGPFAADVPGTAPATAPAALSLTFVADFWDDTPAPRQHAFHVDIVRARLEVPCADTAAASV